jgi:hypothetical protein
MIVTETETIVGELVVASPTQMPIRFTVSDAKINEMRVALTGLVATDKASYELVTKGIAACRDLRGRVEYCRKDLKQHALEYGRKVDAEAKRLTAELESIEQPLKAEKAKADEVKELERRKAEAEKQAMINARLQAFTAVGVLPNYLMLQAWTDEEFAAELEAVTRAYEARKLQEEQEAAEAARVAAEQAEALRIEAEKLAAERAELDRLRAEEAAKQKAEADRRQAELEAIEKQQRLEREELDRERQALKEKLQAVERAEMERQRAIDLEREATEKAEFDRLEAIRVAEEQAELARIEKVNAELEAKRMEAIKPDAEKLKAFGDMLRALPFPEMATDDGKEYLASAVKAIKNTADYCCEAFV